VLDSVTSLLKLTSSNQNLFQFHYLTDFNGNITVIFAFEKQIEKKKRQSWYLLYHWALEKCHCSLVRQFVFIWFLTPPAGEHMDFSYSFKKFQTLLP